MSTTSRAQADVGSALTLTAAHELAAAAALRDDQVGQVGLEVETHLVDLAVPSRRVAWPRVESARGLASDVVDDAAVTVEPGGQIELSGPPAADVETAVGAIRRDLQRARLALAELGLGLAHLGADPARSPQRVNPRPRYVAMAEHFHATGRASAGAAMMNSTAALQLNLQAGPFAGWADRVAHAHRVGPVLIALSSSSPWLAGRDTGWKSGRQQIWGALDAGRPQAAEDPAEAWAQYALQAPVTFVRQPDGGALAVHDVVPFAAWVRGDALLDGRRPGVADLQTHLTTLFPPVRLRGYLELRYLDMSPPRWFPAVAAVAATVMDDPIAAQAAAEACEGVAHLWIEAARDGLRHAGLAQAARRCLAVAASCAPANLAAAVQDLAELVESGRCPGDLLADRIGEVGPLAALDEAARV